MGRSKNTFIALRDQEVNAEVVPYLPKQKVLDLINTLPSKVEEGELHPFEALSFIKHLDNSFKECKTAIETYAFDAISKGETERGGFHFTSRSGGVRYSYKNIPEVAEKEAELKELKDKYKQMYLAKQKGAVHANVNEDGEVLPLPEPMYSKDSLVITKIK